MKQLDELKGVVCPFSDEFLKLDNGKSFEPNYISRKFGKLTKAAGLPSIRYHDLRHTCASLLYAKGFGLNDIKE